MITLEKIRSEFEALKDLYPGLDTLLEIKGGFCIAGNVSIIDSNGWNWATYQIEIRIPNTFPANLPILVETGKKIKRHIDWHISENGVCCVGTPARQYRDMGGQTGLLNWIKLFVIPYLANHAYKVENKKYVDGELAHGAPGIFQDYSSLLNLTSPSEVILKMKYMLGILHPSLNTKCFCGSGKKYKRCYVTDKSAHHYGIPIRVLQKDLRMLIEYY
jgi:hypothetical protein